MSDAETTVTVPARWYERVTDFLTQCDKCGHPISALQVHWTRRDFAADVAQLRAALSDSDATATGQRANFQRRCLACGLPPEPEPDTGAEPDTGPDAMADVMEV